MNSPQDQPVRRYLRAAGPFDGCRLNGQRTAVQVLALGIGGCFIKPIAEQEIGKAWPLQIDLREDGIVELSATTLYHLGDGSAVTFFNLQQDAFERIRRTVDRLKSD